MNWLDVVLTSCLGATPGNAPQQQSSGLTQFPPLGEDSGYETSEGRTIYNNRTKSGKPKSQSSERGNTFRDPKTKKFVNYPSIHKGKELTESQAREHGIKHKWIDPETGRKPVFYDSSDEAIEASKKRSSTLGRIKKKKKKKGEL
tara:strand:+ start:491 stop:925 length:435 start_codon:yes stop_codon:yes gene_type:complete